MATFHGGMDQAHKYPGLYQVEIQDRGNQITCSGSFAGQDFDLRLQLHDPPLCIFRDTEVRVRQVCAALIADVGESGLERRRRRRRLHNSRYGHCNAVED